MHTYKTYPECEIEKSLMKSGTGFVHDQTSNGACGLIFWDRGEAKIQWNIQMLCQFEYDTSCWSCFHISLEYMYLEAYMKNKFTEHDEKIKSR